MQKPDEIKCEENYVENSTQAFFIHKARGEFFSEENSTLIFAS